MSMMSTMTEWKPFPIFDSSWDVAFDDLVRKTFAAVESSPWMPSADVVRDGEDLLMILEVPGLQSGDLELEVHDQILTVRGRRSIGSEGGQKIRSEIRHGEFSRTFRLPRSVISESVRASYLDGFLIVRVSGVTPQVRVSRIPVEGLEQIIQLEGGNIETEGEIMDEDTAIAA